MKWFLPFVLLFACAPAQAQGIFTAASCSRTDVNAVINGPTHTAVDGDTIKIPAGSCAWTTGVTVPAGIGITITGNGTPATTGTGADATCRNTTLTLTGALAFIMAPTVGASLTRLSCMQLTYGSGGSIAFNILGSCNSSTCTNLRVDNLTFTNWTGHTSAGISYGISAVGDMFGVIDHNTISGDGSTYLQLVEQSNASFLSSTALYGDSSWALPEYYGTSKYLFFENNLFNASGCCENEGSAGGVTRQGGGRVVVRFNTFQNMENLNFSMGWHGTESNGRPRSTRSFEYYQNTWTCASACGSVAGGRGGTGLIWGNSIDLASITNTLFTLTTYRTQGSIDGWGGCDGSAPYDTNDGVTYYSDTIASIAGSVITVTGTPGWTINQWTAAGAPYSMHDVTASSGTEITASGSNTLTLSLGGGPGAYAPTVGHSIQILRATACIDEAGGRGAGILYNSASNPANATPANEVLSPTYEWSDTISKLPVFGTTAIGATSDRVMRFREIYEENLNQPAQTNATTPFDGTITTTCPGGLAGTTPCGIGHGSLANRPTTCTTGVAYWASDQGTWNQKRSGGQGQLYTCTSTNTWTLFYTPYTYPHPLVGADVTVPVGVLFAKKGH